MNLTETQRIARLEKAVETLREANRKQYSTYYAAVKRRAKDRERISAQAKALVKNYSAAGDVISRVKQLASYLSGQLIKGRSIMTFTATERQKLMRILKEDERKKKEEKNELA